MDQRSKQRNWLMRYGWSQWSASRDLWEHPQLSFVVPFHRALQDTIKAIAMSERIQKYYDHLAQQ